MKISSHPDHNASRVELVALVQHRHSFEARPHFNLRALGGHDLFTSAVGPSEVSVQFSVGSVAFHCAYSLQVEVQGVNNFCADFSVSEDRKQIVAIPFDLIVDLGDLRTGQSRVSETN